jgi:hypothetical protein
MICLGFFIIRVLKQTKWVVHADAAFFETKHQAVSQGARRFGMRSIRPVCEQSQKAAQRRITA